MSVNIGINIQRSPNRINQQLREAGVGGKYPKLLLDFADNYYLANGGSKTLANAVTHARAGNATMTDGYGPELVVNGGFTSDSDWTKGTGWSIANGYAHHASGANSNITQSIAVEADKAYIIEFNILEGSADFLWFAVAGVFTAVESPQVRGKRSFVFTHDTTESIAVGIRAGSSNVATIDNVSVREMPVLKWAPHNELTYSAFDSATPTNWSVGFGTGTYNHTLGSEISNLPTITQEQTASGRSYLTQNVTLKANTIYTLKMLVDENLSSITDGNNKILSANISGASGTLSASIDDVSDGKVEITFTTGSTTSGTVRTGIGVLNDAVGTVVFAAPHLYRSDLGGMADNPERGDSYVPTTSSAVYLPRVGHHVYNGGSAWVNEGVLAESESRTNLVTYSEDFTDSSWTTSASSVTKKTGIVAPDGSENVYHFQEDTNNTQHQLTTNLTAGTQVFSVFAKGDGSGRYLKLYGYGLGTAGEAPVFDVDNGIVYEPPTQTHFLSASIQDVGNGWYRCSLRADTDAGTGDPAFALVNATNSHGTVGYTGDGTSGVYLYGAQLEATSGQASSYIPTSGSSVTRAAETFTIPSANLPWPPEVLSGVEEVTSGTFDTAAALDDFSTTGTVTYDTATQSARLQSSSELIQFLDGTDNVSGSYKISWNQTLVSGTRTRLLARNHPNTLYISTAYFVGSGEKSIVVTTTDGVMFRISSDNSEALIDNISVQKVEDKAVSIGMEGRMTYADTDTNQEAMFYRWLDGSNFILNKLRTDGSRTGQLYVAQSPNGGSVITATNYYSPDILVPFDMASRHGSTFINAATEGVALTADTTPTALPDLSATDLELAYDYMGTISEFRVWDKDLGDAGIVEATNPSLEPSLSLTFEGVGTNSFTVSDWSE